jgi:hypothetical protein
MVLAVGIPVTQTVDRSPQRRDPPPSPGRGRSAKGGEGGGANCRRAQAGELSCLPPLVRDAFAGSGYDIRTVQELLGHSDVSTIMIYTHVMNKGVRGVTSPLDRIGEPRAAYRVGALAPGH